MESGPKSGPDKWPNPLVLLNLFRKNKENGAPGTIILVITGAIILGMLYSITLPRIYLGSTLVRPAKPSAFPRYTFLSKTIRSMSETNRTAGTADFNYKIDDKFGAI